jgi:hypothetical protein
MTELPEYYLHRQPSANGATLGELVDDAGEHICDTLELAWNNNDSDTSCIPAGSYICIPHDSAKFPDTWEVSDVPDRSAILIHNGNVEENTHGCILVGDSEGMLNNQPAVLNSVATLKMLRDELPDTFTLHITQ